MGSISYKKLWKLLIDKNMNKSDLRLKAGISTTTIAKLSKGETIRSDILVRICTALDCDTSDIMEFDRDGTANVKMSDVIE
ncbi:MAG: helix-turn-helix transcriptional regulator [Clostridiales bacterium]|jgi:DNA-binding Xre family transcriptional regulator|nr:helix-turn-helix transcriptional regulator [Clostridiales bacterium]